MSYRYGAEDMERMRPTGARLVWSEETEAPWDVIVDWAQMWAPGAGVRGSRERRLAEINEHRHGRYDLPPFRVGE